MRTRAFVCPACGIDFLAPDLEVWYNGQRLPPEPRTCSSDCERKRVEANWERVFERLFPSQPAR